MEEAGLLRLDFSLPQLHKPPLYLALSASLKRLPGLDVDTGLFLEGLSNRNLEMSIDRYSLDKSKCLSREINDCGRDSDSASSNVILGSNAF